MIPTLAIPGAIASWVVGGLVRLTTAGVQDVVAAARAAREHRRLLRLAVLQAMATDDRVWWVLKELEDALQDAGAHASTRDLERALGGLERRGHVRQEDGAWCGTWAGFSWASEQVPEPPAS